MDTKKIKAAGTETAAAIEAGAQLATPQPSVQTYPDGSWMLVKPDGYSVEDLSGLMPAPRRLKTNINFSTGPAFAAYLNLFGDKTKTVVFVNPTEFKMRACLDYHATPTMPSWLEHNAMFAAKKTKPWVAWEHANGFAFDQFSLAEFLDLHIGEIAEPAGLADVIRQLEVIQVVKFTSHQRVDNGAVKLSWDENTEGKSGTITIPTEFKLYVPIFEGGEFVTLNAKLRWKFVSGARAVEFKFHIDEMDATIEKEFNRVVASIGDETRESVRAILSGTL